MQLLTFVLSVFALTTPATSNAPTASRLLGGYPKDLIAAYYRYETACAAGDPAAMKPLLAPNFVFAWQPGSWASHQKSLGMLAQIVRISDGVASRSLPSDERSYVSLLKLIRQGNRAVVFAK